MKYDTSSSSTIETNPSSATNTSLEGSYMNVIKELMEKNSKPKTPAQIRAAGEVTKVKWLIILVGTICVLLIISGSIIQLVYPESGKEVWTIFAPIITSGLSGTLGYLAGDKQGEKK